LNRPTSPSAPLGLARCDLQGVASPGKWKHCHSDLGIAEDGILSGNDQIAGERKFKTAGQRKTLHRGERRNAQRFYGPVSLIQLSDEGSKPIGILAEPFTRVAPETEVRPLCPED
jgi:hypothetical protein